MIWATTAAAFLGTLGTIWALVYAFCPGDIGVASRLTQIWQSRDARQAVKPSIVEAQSDRVERVLANMGKLLPESNPKQVSRARLLMFRAGYRSPEALLVVRGLKILCPAATLAAVYFTGFYKNNPVFIFALALALGYLLPEILISQKAQRRQASLRRALPDALDLLVICVEAGLGLDQAMLRVSQEIHISYPELSEELQLVNLEIRVGKSRLEALRELGVRTGVEDIKSLASMLVQTERFGTSVAQSLRVHSDAMRVTRRQRAEEMAAKTTVKMVPPLVFFIFPALMVVILGPAVITLVRQLIPALK